MKFLEAIEVNPKISLKKDYLDFYLARAKANMALEKYAAAIKDYKKYLTRHHATTNISFDLARAYFHTYKYDEAEKELTALRNAAGMGEA